MIRYLTSCLRNLVAASLLLSVAWGGLALFYRLPFEEPARLGLAGFYMLLGSIAVLGVIRSRWLPLPFYLACFVGVLVWWPSLEPSNMRAWAPSVERQPALAIYNDQLIVRNLRAFQWQSEDRFRPVWEDRIYDLAKLEGVDLFLSYWTGPAVAHVIVSFPFKESKPLAFSIEIRREEHEVYSPLAGLFKQYELTIIAADERDVIRLRTDVWKEDVRLYRLAVSPDKARALIEGYIREVNDISINPRWYDTLGGNCTTIAFRLAQTIWPDLSKDWRIIASGYVPEYAYELGALDMRFSLPELEQRGAITKTAQEAGDTDDFSQQIRMSVPKPLP